jgi:exodeoxyribonuclease VII large subunit
LIAAARVQGEGASHEIVSAIKFLNEHHQRALRDGKVDGGIDVMIVGRGGGSIEDLWAFNEEAVARAIRNSVIPVISAVGHETDFTIADFVADMRAPTPSAAAEMVAAHENELGARLGSLSATLARSIQYRIAGARNEVQELALSNAFDAVAGRVRDALTTAGAAEYRLQAALREALQAAHHRLGDASRGVSPMQLRSVLTAGRERFGSLKKSHEATMTARIDNAKRELALRASSLDAMSPLKVLERGYAIAHDEHGRVMREASAVSIGDELRLRLWKGSVDCRVEGKDEN